MKELFSKKKKKNMCIFVIREIRGFTRFLCRSFKKTITLCVYKQIFVLCAGKNVSKVEIFFCVWLPHASVLSFTFKFNCSSSRKMGFKFFLWEVSALFRSFSSSLIFPDFSLKKFEIRCRLEHFCRNMALSTSRWRISSFFNGKFRLCLEDWYSGTAHWKSLKTILEQKNFFFHTLTLNSIWISKTQLCLSVSFKLNKCNSAAGLLELPIVVWVKLNNFMLQFILPKFQKLL